MSTKRPRISGDFSLGGDQAEADPLLSEAFLNTGDYRAIESRDDPRAFLVARTGAGKSASLQRLEQVYPQHVIRIRPEDLSLRYITDLNVVKFLDELDINLDPFWIALWKHVFLVEIIRKRYKVDSLAAKQNFLDMLRERLSRDHAKRAALDYLDEFESKFWCEADERIRDITESFTEKIKIEAGGSIDLKVGSVGFGSSEDVEHHAEQASQRIERFQRVVNDQQLPRLNKMLQVLDEDILSSPQDFMYVIVDDLDRDWVDERISNDLIRCLIRTVHELKRVHNLKIVVALRTNLFRELDFGRRSGGQEEKYRSLVLDMRWTANDLEEMLDERVRAAAKRAHVDLSGIRDLLPAKTNKRGDPVEFIISRTLLRPRDAINFVNEAIARSSGSTRVSWEDLTDAELAYSHNRLLALRDEWKVTYPEIDKVLEKFRGAPWKLARMDLQNVLDDVMLIASDHTRVDTRWLLELSEAAFTPGAKSWGEMYGPLTRFLFGIGFLGVRVHERGPAVFSTQDPLFLQPDSRLENANGFFIHRAYSLALDVSEP